MKKGTTVILTAGQLGTIEHPDASRFTDVVTKRHDLAAYFGKHPNPELAKTGWHLVTVQVDDRLLYVPVGEDHFEQWCPACHSDRKNHTCGLKGLQSLLSF